MLEVGSLEVGSLERAATATSCVGDREGAASVAARVPAFDSSASAGASNGTKTVAAEAVAAPFLELKPHSALKRADFFARSFLGFGADQVRERLWSRLAAHAKSSSSSSSSSSSTSSSSSSSSSNSSADALAVVAVNPCGFAGHRVSWAGATLVGSGDADECANAVAELLLADGCGDSGLLRAPADEPPDEPSNEPCRLGARSSLLPDAAGSSVVAMSVYFFAADCVRVLGPLLANRAAGPAAGRNATAKGEAAAAVSAAAAAAAAAPAAPAAAAEAAEVVAEAAWRELATAWPSPSVHALSAATAGFCGSRWADVSALAAAHAWTWPHQMPHRCFEAVLVAQLLLHGVGVQRHARQVTYAVALRGMEVEWTLGFALAAFAGGDSGDEAAGDEERER
jgi:hypothetical protein